MSHRVSEATGERSCPFNSLYWHFLIRHEDRLRSNHRMGMIYRNLERMVPAKREAVQQWGDYLLAKLDSGQNL